MKLKKKLSLSFLICFLLLLNGCVVGPNYHRPHVSIPFNYKEQKHPNWKLASPCDHIDRGEWWTIFNNRTLNSLESQLNIANQNIVKAEAQYAQSRALIDVARAAYFPTLSVSASHFYQGTSSSSGSTNNNVNQINLNAAWEPDIWGGTRRNVEASTADALASFANIANIQLSEEASLAQYYFELRGIDSDQQLLNKTISDDKKLLTLTQNRFQSGVNSMVDIVQARAQLESVEAENIHLGIVRAQYEHAIAVLMGEPPAYFSLKFNPFYGKPPTIPPELPGSLLERRPDIAFAERTVASANAKIGVAVSAYFPNLSLAASGTIQSINNWFLAPIYIWSLGPTLAQTIFDGGLRSANVRVARANYHAMVAQYRETVLNAFQEVEDDLASVRILKSESRIQNRAAKDAKLALNLKINQYKAGIASYSDVLTAQINDFNAQKSAVDVNTLRMVSTIGLMKALGGSWNIADSAPEIPPPHF